MIESTRDFIKQREEEGYKVFDIRNRFLIKRDESNLIVGIYELNDDERGYHWALSKEVERR